MKHAVFDLTLRFFFGGLAVAGCYLLLAVIPWKTLAGAFAAFPAVMVAAVIMAGLEKGNKAAADVASGAVAGMIGGLFCVICTFLVLVMMNSLLTAVIFGLIMWLLSSAVTFKIKENMYNHKHHRLHKTNV